MSQKKTIFIYICVFLAGVLLIVFNSSAELLETIVHIIGVALAIPSIIVGIYTFTNKIEQKERMKLLTLVVCIGCACLGLAMIFAAGMFVNILRYVFAFALVASGLQQIVLLLLTRRTTKMAAGFYLVPTLSVIAGIVLAFVTVEQIEAAVALITGITLAAVGINGIVGFFIRRRLEKDLVPAASEGEIIEVEAIENNE